MLILIKKENTLLKDHKISKAVSRIIQRSERQETIQKLLETYVDVGVLPQLNNTNHQIFYGRRGTGKTHVIKVLETHLKEDNHNTIVYIDCRTLGSTSQFTDQDLPISKRCLALFRDILLCMYHELLEHIVQEPSENAEQAMEEADHLAQLITVPLNIFKMEKLTTQEESTSNSKDDISVNSAINPTPHDVKIAFARERRNTQAERQEAQYVVDTEDKIIFPELQRCLKKVLDLAKTRLYLLIDEWSSLPQDIQPYLAEFLKRGFLPISSATLKIAALEYRCRFSENIRGNRIGFELGPEIATATDLDDYFVFDRNPNKIVDVYLDILLKHLASELEENYLSREYSISNTRQFSSRLFTEHKTFEELARASEGVIRDLINIFTLAFFHAQRRDRTSIDKKAILESAQQWFEQDKAQYLDDHLQEVLRRIVDEVIGNRRARAFLLPRQLEKNVVVQKLFDARVLHHLKRGYADKDNPGLRYNIYAIDYGTYVDLIGTSKQPSLDLDFEKQEDDLVVPFDDKRSIRRIILNEKILEP
jgi:hypothetical protein